MNQLKRWWLVLYRYFTKLETIAEEINKAHEEELRKVINCEHALIDAKANLKIAREKLATWERQHTEAKTRRASLA